jgi:hypothetical protein
VVSIAATSASIFAFSTKRREVSTMAISAARHAATSELVPVEKLSIAGTRCTACSAKNVTSAPRDVGSSTPTRSPGRLRAASTEPSAWLAVMSPP